MVARSQWILYCLKDFPILRFTSWVSSPCLHCIQRHKQIYVTVTLFPIKAKQCFACRYKYRQKHLHFCRTSRWSEKEKNHIQIYKTDEKCGKMWKTRNRFHCTIHNFHVIGPCFTWCPRKILWEIERAKAGFLWSTGKHLPFLSCDWLKFEVAK